MSRIERRATLVIRLDGRRVIRADDRRGDHAARTTVRSGDGGAYLRDVTVHLAGSEGAAAGVVVGIQFTTGSVAPLPIVTAANGDATLTWTIPVSQMVPGHTHALGFCAHASGASCSIDLNNEPVIRVSF